MKKLGVLVVSEDKVFQKELENYWNDSNFISFVVFEENVLRGLELLQKQEELIDIILVDYHPPFAYVLAFFEVLKKLKLNKKIVVTTRQEYLNDIGNLLNYSIQSFLLKPFSFSILESRILKMYEKKEEKIISFEASDIENRITELLIGIGMPVNLKGFHYIREAIYLVIEKKELLNSVTKNLYPTIADHFSSTGSRVERSMRNAIEISFTRGNLKQIEKLFCYSIDLEKAKPSNSEFISILAEKVSSDMKRDHFLLFDKTRTFSL